MNTIFDHALWVSPLFWTLMLLGAAIILFVHNKIRMDVVALLVMLSFYLSGILSIQEILVGFSDPNIILIALLFIVRKRFKQQKTEVKSRSRTAGGYNIAVALGGHFCKFSAD